MVSSCNAPTLLSMWISTSNLSSWYSKSVARIESSRRWRDLGLFMVNIITVKLKFCFCSTLSSFWPILSSATVKNSTPRIKKDIIRIIFWFQWRIISYVTQHFLQDVKPEVLKRGTLVQITHATFHWVLLLARLLWFFRVIHVPKSIGQASSGR